MKTCSPIVFILLQFISLLALSQNQQLKFQRIGTKEGLSDPNVNCIMQDSRGFVWIGTRYGLNRYDGYKFMIFYSDPSDTSSLSNSYIKDLLEDKNGDIWIATSGGGFNKYERQTHRFKQYNYQPNRQNSVSGNIINKMIEDRTGKLWIATNNGLNLFDPKSNRFIQFPSDKNKPNSISDNNIVTAFADSQGDLWFGTQSGGLNKFNPKDSTFIRYQADKSDANAVSGNHITAIFEDSNHRLWIGASTEGLNLFNRETGTFSHFLKPSVASALLGKSILSISEDEKGNLWIGSENGGINLFNYMAHTFRNYTKDDIDESSLSKNSVYSITKDKNGNMWLGIYGGGINLCKKSMNNFNHFKHNSSPNSLSNDFVLSIYEDQKENLWVGTDGGGLNYFDRETGKSQQFMHHKSENSIGEDYVLTLTEDEKDNLWIGTWAGGMSKFNLKTHQFTNFKLTTDHTGLSSGNVYDLAVARNGKIWIGTFNGGVNLYDEQSNRFTYYRYNKADSTSISSDNVFSILSDQTGKVWIGTFDGGVCLYEPKTNSFIRFNKENKKLINNTVSHLFENRSGIIYACTLGGGLNYFDPSSQRFIPIETVNKFASEYIYAALEDLNGDIWASTNKGISMYDPKTRTVSNFTIEDGLQEGEFKPHSAFKAKSGMLYFGGVNGYNSFFPDQIKRDHYNSPVVLTDFQIFNKSVPIAKDQNDLSPLKQDISETKSIRLNHKQSVITFEFASLDYTSPDKKTYAYMMKGFDEDWNIVGSKNSATYTNLNHGKYVFKVMSQNRNGEWSKEIRTLNITIDPPYWLTWWFKTLLCLVLVIAPAGFTVWRIRLLHTQREKLEKLVAERTNEIQNKNELLKDLNSTKDKLFSVISHDLRSPFNAILGFEDLLLNNYREFTDEERIEMIRQVHTTTNQVYILVENLLNWAKIQNSSIQHHPKSFNLREVIHDISDLYQNIALAKGIKVDHQIPEGLVPFADIHLMETILRNLISNAIKFTPAGGSIHVKASQAHAIIKVSVTDTGMGMTKEQIDSLFNLETTQTKQGTSGEKGSGLGLVLCKEFVEKNGGKITVVSHPNKGSTFSFTMPAAKDR